MRYLLIKNGIIENAIEWDGASEYEVPDGYELIQSDLGDIGQSWPLPEII